MRYFTNFAGDEIDGKVYANVGEEVEGADPGTIAFLVGQGRLTARGDDDGEGSSLGEPGVNTGLSDARPVADMQRGELIGEARRHFETHIGQADDDQLRQMIEGARRQAEGSTLDLDDLSPPERDAAVSSSTASPTPPPAPAPAPQSSDSFVPASIVAANVDDVVAKLDGLNGDQLDQVEEAEKARPGGPRKGVTDAIAAKREG